MYTKTNSAKANFSGQPDSSHWIAFLILPFFAGVKALQNFRASWSKNVFWAFVVFTGLTFTIGRETATGGANSGGDINRYAGELKDLRQIRDIKDALKYYEGKDEVDYLKKYIAIVLSRFTDSHYVLTTVYAFIFGFFFSRNLWYILSRIKGKLKTFSILLFTAYFLLDPFWSINGFRFFTALHIFVYGLLPYIYEGKKPLLLVSCTSILVHFTFIVPVSIVAIYLLLGNRAWLYMSLFILSSIFKEINITAFSQFVENVAPDAFVERSSGYLDEENVAEFRGDDSDTVVIKKNLYARLYLPAIQKSCSLLLLFLFFRSRKIIRTSKGLYSAFCFSLLFFAIANILSSVPSGGRFLAIACMVALSCIIFYYQNFPKERYLENLLLFLTPALLLFIIVASRIGLYSLSITTIIGNPLLGLFSDYNIALNDLIK